MQLSIIFDRLSTTSFSLTKEGNRSTVVVSPFRLGPEVNTRTGVAMITSAADATRLYENLGRKLWDEAVTGEKVAQFIRAQVERATRWIHIGATRARWRQNKGDFHWSKLAAMIVISNARVLASTRPTKHARRALDARHRVERRQKSNLRQVELATRIWIFEACLVR